MALWGKREDMIVHETEPYNAEPPRSALAGRLLTSIETFYARNHGRIPCIHPDAWQLRIDGLVEHPDTLSLMRLRTEFEHREVIATLQCAGNRRADLMAVRDIPGHAAWKAGAISTARWTGVSLADVLARAGLTPGAAHVAFTACDVAPMARPPQPFGGSIPISKAVAGEVLLAWAMNGRLLPQIHGGPVRLVVPGYIGARSVKWVERITVQDHPSDNYFQAIDYRLLPAGADPELPGEGLCLGPVALNADILTPDDGAILPAGPVTVSGYALGGHQRDVARVDISLDHGRTWCQADLGPDLAPDLAPGFDPGPGPDPGPDFASGLTPDLAPGPWAWRHWSRTFELPPGDLAITARAWDTAACSQPERPEPLWNPGGYVNNAWPRVHVTVR